MDLEIQRLEDITVLYCEDEQDLREAMEGVLNNFTKKQFVAVNGQEGFELFEKHKDEIDLIITDVNMPKLNGLEMSTKIKEINSEIPIIVATAFSNSEYLLEAIDIGIDKYVLKPINIKKLLSTMTQSLLYHELRDLYRDSLTKLPTRNALLKDLTLQKDTLVALIDIDNFSQLNDLYGEENGDKILVEFSKKLKDFFMERTTIYRVGADKFLLVTKSEDCTVEILEKAVTKFHELIDDVGITIQNDYDNNDNIDVFFNLTTGIALSSDQHAYEYSQRAVQKARKSFLSIIVYDANTSSNVKDFEENLKWIKKLKTGIHDGNFKPYFQPIVTTQTQEIYKYEALIRYVENDGTQIAPFFFLDIAKQAKLFPVIIKIMLLGSIKVIKEKNIQIAVNISYDDILNDNTMNFIYETLEKNPNEAKLIDFELLESEEIKDFNLAALFINKARSYGCRVGVDDFGAGYSNFNMLEALNIDFVKIDGSLIKNIHKLPKQALIVETINEFCKKLGIYTVAEFVSCEEEYNIIKRIGIDKIQGWYFGKAMSAEDI